MRSIYKNNFFDNETFDKIKAYVLDQKKDMSSWSYGEELTRYYKVVFLPEEFSTMFLNIAKKETGDDSLEIVYSQIVDYRIKDGLVPELRGHKDITTGEWVMDMVIDGTIDWPLIINGESFSNVPNSIFFIKGEEEVHGRPDFPSSSEDDHLTLLFVHLAQKDSEYMRISKGLFQMSEKSLNALFRAARPGWRN